MISAVSREASRSIFAGEEASLTSPIRAILSINICTVSSSSSILVIKLPHSEADTGDAIGACSLVRLFP